jgi:hypothetical protein
MIKIVSGFLEMLNAKKFPHPGFYRSSTELTWQSLFLQAVTKNTYPNK